MARTAERAGHAKLIGFDMGGTSTDVSHFAGEYERAFDSEVGGGRVRAPMMSIHSIAAGGGSIIRFDGGRLRGRVPGPHVIGAGDLSPSRMRMSCWAASSRSISHAFSVPMPMNPWMLA